VLSNALKGSKEKASRLVLLRQLSPVVIIIARQHQQQPEMFDLQMFVQAEKKGFKFSNCTEINEFVKCNKNRIKHMIVVKRCLPRCKWFV